METYPVPVEQETHPDPYLMLEGAVRAAKALQSIIRQKRNPVIINNEQYLEFEDWQALAQFFGYTVRTKDAQPVEINGVHGAYARAEVIDLKTGAVIGGAEAYCMRDEPRWADRPWFQLASMAQTRAGAKALRNRLAWVVMLAGYQTTPAEEMTENHEPAEPPPEPEAWCEKHQVPFKRYRKGDDVWYAHKLPEGGFCRRR